MFKNEKGLTLLEVLVTLVIVSFIGIIIWSVFNSGIKYSNNEISKNQMQQEANIILTTLTKIHQKATSYSIVSDGSCSITVNANINNKSEVYEFENKKLCINITHNNMTEEFDPINKNNIVTLYITISEINNTENEITIDGVLSRLKDY